MIPVDRNRQLNGQPIHPGAAWRAKADAETVIARQEGTAHVVKDSIYADERVRAALEEITHFKCAYCETALDRFDWDIEHFRPKGRVTERFPEHPGYYWLAYEWTNLLPSCVHCNQRRKEKPVFDGQAGSATGGKADQFPIRNELKRAMDHNGDITQEENLLIDPSRDNPLEFLGYLPNGELFAVGGSDRGKASIEVFGLNLFRIRRSRRGKLKSFVEVAEILRSARLIGNAALIVQVEGLLQGFAADDAEFAGMARYFTANPEALGIA